MGATIVDRKGASDYASSFLTAFIKSLGFKRILVRSDKERSLLSLIERVTCNLTGVELFDENDTLDWQDTVWEAQLTDAHDEHDRQETLMDQQAQPDTDVPGVWRCQIEPKSDLYGDKTGKLLDPEKVIKGRLTELEHMNDHHVYDWIDEAEIPKGTKVETSRWLDDIKPRDGDENSVRLDVHQGTPPLKVLRNVACASHE